MDENTWLAATLLMLKVCGFVFKVDGSFGPQYTKQW